MVQGMLGAHEGMAYLIVLSTTVSLILALVTAVFGPRPGVLRVGRVLGRAVEPATSGLTGIFGVILWIVARAGLWNWVMWAGVVAVALSPVFSRRLIRPTLDRLTAGEAVGWRWAGLAFVHWLWFVAIFGLMEVFSRL